MIMKRLLTTDNKRSIRKAFKDNALFRVINAAYKEFETQMETLQFSPEEIFINCFIGFDKILKNRDEVDEITVRMWNDTYCELRDDAEDISRDYTKNELETATSCIVYTIVACMIASEDWNIMKHTESLMCQIEEHTNLNNITLPFEEHIDNALVEYLQHYIKSSKYISERINNPKNYEDPINHVRKPKDRLNAKENIKKRLEFMNGVMPDGETPIMQPAQFRQMIEAVEYLIENNVVKILEEKIHTRMPIADLRYTFYLVYQNGGKIINRQLWIDFLGATFSQMQNNKASLPNHFSDIPNNYDKYIKHNKKK